MGKSVRVKYDPSREAELSAAGVEVSEVRWKDTGHRQFIPNKHLEDMSPMDQALNCGDVIPPFLRIKKGERRDSSHPVMSGKSTAMDMTAQEGFRARYPETEVDRRAREKLEEEIRTSASRKKDQKFERWNQRKQEKSQHVPGSRWDIKTSRWVHPALSNNSAPGSNKGDTSMAKKAAKKSAVKKAPAERAERAPRVVTKPPGKVEDFGQVRENTDRAKVLIRADAGDTIAAIAKKIDKDEGYVKTALYMINRDCGIGYTIGEDQRVTLKFPGSRSLKDAIKSPAEEKEAA